MMADPDQAKAKRAADAMLKMVKLDIAALKAAHSGTWINERDTHISRFSSLRTTGTF